MISIFPLIGASETPTNLGLLFVTGGSTDNSELIDLTGQKRICSTIDPIPTRALGSFSLLNRDGEPMVCALGSAYICFSLFGSNRTWSEGIPLDFFPYYNRAVLVGDPALRNYWIMGGGYRASPRTSYYYNGVDQFTESQREVATDVFGDCLLRLAEDEQLLVNDETWMIKDGTWTKQAANFQWEAENSQQRTFQFGICGLVYDKDGNPEKAVVGAGTYGDIFTQIFDIATRSWRRGPNLPGSRYETVNVAAGRSFLVVGGNTKVDGTETRVATVIEFNPDSEEWVIRPERLSTGRSNMYAIMVDENVIAC